MERLGRYRIIRLLGTGAMGEVYLAEQELLLAPRAIKILRQKLADSPDFRAGLVEEGRVLASLEHPNIISVHDMGIEDNVYYLAMDLRHA